MPQGEAVGDDLDAPSVADRRIEVQVGEAHVPRNPRLSLATHGRQRAPAQASSRGTKRGEAHPRSDVQPGLAVEAAAKRKRCDTYPELGKVGRCPRGSWC